MEMAYFQNSTFNYFIVFIIIIKITENFIKVLFECGKMILLNKKYQIARELLNNKNINLLLCHAFKVTIINQYFSVKIIII